MYIVVGLGNPGEKYEQTRHNAGRMAVLALKDVSARIITPDTFMNKSGEAVKPLIKSAKQAEKLIVVHDDLDMPFGTFKISFNKSSGGHKGVESIIRAVKTQAFTRIRIGISPTTASGKLKPARPNGRSGGKPKGAENVERHILGKFKPAELAVLQKLHKKINEAVICLITDGREKAMSIYN